MKTFIICILSYSTFSFCQTSKSDFSLINYHNTLSNSTTAISITISLDTNIYLMGQQTWMNVQFKNESDKLDSLAGIDELGVLESVIIKNEYGGILEYKGLMDGQIGIHYYKLKPHEIRNIETELRDVYGDLTQSNERIIFSPRNFFTAGKYTVNLKKINYETKSVIKSNSLDFSVVNPEGNDDSEFDVLKGIYYMADVTNGEKVSKISSYREFIQDYKNSKYFDEIFYVFVRMKNFSNISYNESSLIEIKEYLENKPNTFQSKRLAWYLADAVIKYGGGKNQAIILLQDLKNKFPGTRLSEGIERVIDSQLFKK